MKDKKEQENNEEQKQINQTYDDLKKVIADAANIKTDINTNFKESLKTARKDFSDFMSDNVSDEFREVAERLGLFNGCAEIEDNKKREKKENAALRSFFGKMFNKSVDFDFNKKGGKPKENTPPKPDTYALDLIASLYASTLIPEVKRALDTAGIEVRFTKPITGLDLQNNEDDKKTVATYITCGSNIKNDIFEKNAEIEDVIFESIPDNMKYDAESNPKGIKKAQFNALAELQSKSDELSMNGDAEKASDMVEKQCDKHHENSKNQEMLAIVTELILTPNEESGPQAPVSYEEALGGTEDAPNPEEPPIDHDMPGTETIHQEENLEELVAEDMD